ncbi:dUTPase [Staphylococcus americanisciuri]|uniref:dUTPase n=1 Tax=Staphylococcus americanisciuri TaxID=2973940 RepID=A0ABT2F1N6_9STAP|nr:dUTPase [Staphylococcus americanisciuri]MCS4486370.1 dUTPase [Staphylococcus americanisciuri]
MTNKITVEQLQELLLIQKEFDDRIPTLNLEDSKIAYIVEFFEWFNTLETFKNWKKNPGKPLEVQLDELADMLAFGLSIANQSDVRLKSLKDVIDLSISKDIVIDKSKLLNMFLDPEICLFILEEHQRGSDEEEWLYLLCSSLPIDIAYRLYSIDQLINAYKKKMERNHARQDGTADVEKGYV